MAKSIQCPACGSKHPVTALPDAPSFRCAKCGQSLKVPAQFRPSVQASRPSQRPSPPRRGDATAALPKDGAGSAAAAAAAAAPAAPAAARASHAAKPRGAAVRPGATKPVTLPWRALAWAAALPLALVVTVWLARTSGWLSGERLVDVFTGTGFTRYIRVVAIAPVWALFTALFLTLFLEGGQALARRRAEKRLERDGSRRGMLRRQSESPEASDAGRPDEPAAAGDGRRSKRTAAQRGSR